MPTNKKNWREWLRVRLLGLSRTHKRLLLSGIDVVTAIVVLGVSVGLTNPILFEQVVPLLLTAMVISATLMVTGGIFGIYRVVVRYISLDFLTAALRVSAATAGAGYLALVSYAPPLDVARTMAVFACVLVIAIMWIRFAARSFLNARRRRREGVIIYGAGSGGMRVAASLAGSTRYLPLCFVDDDKRLIGRRIGGLEVFNAVKLSDIIPQTGAHRVLLAMPSATRRRRRQIIEALSTAKVRVQTIPDMGDIVSGAARIDDIQDVSVEDLLGRDPVPPKADLLSRENRCRVVLVTGAGGSIGSELCRKLLETRPRQLLLVERSEIALYTIERQLRKERSATGIDVDIIGMLGCVRDRQRMLEIMRTFQVDTVYHAAAYKHVPIVEHNVLEGVSNNVLGTLEAAEAAVEANVKTFVLVSTDKAVSPTNVMGASKRMAELILQDLDRRARTKFCMVRFGNVLASSGSVVPLFREQIRSGGPVTVTHPEIIRYFMTIPEAAQLVIQAGAMAEGGDVFVLDMGKPVKIVDLATKMIQLMGKTVRSSENPNGEIEISFTGLRPAEKLYEELLIGSDVTGTSHPRIMRANEQYIDTPQLKAILGEIRAAIDERDWRGLRDTLLGAVEGYSPTGEIEDHVYTRLLAPAGSGKVTPLDMYRRPD